ncbi:uroporphyrinogen-III C-methyltransferase [Azoarcus sp. L1K30]|nr:uroporphyrinogen-III C-methyltransferase [Azoarcus sp. L1K30]
MKEETPALTQPPQEADMSSASHAGAAPEPVSARAATTGSTTADGKRGGAGWAILLALVALGVAGGAVWQAWQVRGEAAGLREELARRLAEGDTVATEARAIARQQQELISGMQGKLGALESKVEETEGQAAALETLYQQFSSSREDSVVAEVEQAVTIAAQQLQLAGNVESALIALQGAETRLAMQDRGQLAPLRRALVSDIDALKQIPVVDVPGMALRLEQLLERADEMPLAFTGELQGNAGERVQVEHSGGIPALDFAKQLALDVWHDIRGLVRIERLDPAAEPVLLAPAQSTFLRENLKIRLLTARLALLAHDGRTYAADLAQARSWVERFFNVRDERVTAALAELRALEAMPVNIERKGLTNSFAALRLLQSRPAPTMQSAPAHAVPKIPVKPAAQPAPAAPAGDKPAAAPQG